MKKITISNLFLLILLVSMTVVAFRLWQDRKDLKEENELLVSNQGAAVNVITDRYVSPLDSIPHAEYQDRIVTRNQLKAGQVPISKTLLDSMVMGLKIANGDKEKAYKQITELTRVIATLKGSLPGEKVDPATGILRTYTSEYLTANVDTSYRLNYLYKLDLRTIAGTTPTGFLGMGVGRHWVDFSSPDSNLVIDSVNRFRVEVPVKKRPWGIGFFAGYSASQGEDQAIEFKPAIGAGVTYNFGRF